MFIASYSSYAHGTIHLGELPFFRYVCLKDYRDYTMKSDKVSELKNTSYYFDTKCLQSTLSFTLYKYSHLSKLFETISNLTQESPGQLFVVTLRDA